MNWVKLFAAQAELDKHIEQKKGLQGIDLLDKKILALLVELGELANEWRGFKFWSNDQEPRTEHECKHCEGEGSFVVDTNPIPGGEEVIYVDCRYCNSEGYLDKNPLLEEYVDCLHFILSIGNELDIDHSKIKIEDDLTGETGTETFSELFSYVSTLYIYLDVNLPATITKEDIEGAFHNALECFVGLGEKHLGFTWEEIEEAYFSKNKINHERQETNY